MHIPRKVALAILASVSVAGMAGASAATLGGITSGSVGSDDAVVAACQTNPTINVGYTTAYSAAAQTFQVTAVNVTGVDATCAGKTATIALRNGTTQLTTQTVNAISLTGGAFTFTLSTPVSANALNGTSLVIAG